MLRLALRDPMLHLRRSLETSIRKQVSEHVVLQVHDQVYAPVRAALDPIHAAVEEALSAALGLRPRSPDPFRTAIAELRALLKGNAKERELQRVLCEGGLLDPTGTCRAIAEVAMEATDDDPRGMRMDLVVGSAEDEPAQIIELKRGSHRLLARRGTPAERISRPLEKALHQLKSYGERINSAPETRLDIEARHELELERLELRLVAGRRLHDAHDYHLLSRAEPDDAALELQISTWDGFLAELERIAVG
jgi:hypothetical protein